MKEKAIEDKRENEKADSAASNGDARGKLADSETKEDDEVTAIPVRFKRAVYIDGRK